MMNEMRKEYSEWTPVHFNLNAFSSKAMIKKCTAGLLTRFSDRRLPNCFYT
ncbi:hypothetical protein EVA_22640 [gut metagenome]|uniref:Uncharacterized protein n=1 Tax=gut metagenome TaxID=749906 RepID=J9FPE2_9ZZZZ